MRLCPGAWAAPVCHTVEVFPSRTIWAVVPGALAEAVAVCVPLKSTGSL